MLVDGVHHLSDTRSSVKDALDQLQFPSRYDTGDPILLNLQRVNRQLDEDQGKTSNAKTKKKLAPVRRTSPRVPPTTDDGGGPVMIAAVPMSWHQLRYAERVMHQREVRENAEDNNQIAAMGLLVLHDHEPTSEGAGELRPEVDDEEFPPWGPDSSAIQNSRRKLQRPSSLGDLLATTRGKTWEASTGQRSQKQTPRPSGGGVTLRTTVWPSQQSSGKAVDRENPAVNYDQHKALFEQHGIWKDERGVLRTRDGSQVGLVQLDATAHVLLVKLQQQMNRMKHEKTWNRRVNKAKVVKKAIDMARLLKFELKQRQQEIIEKNRLLKSRQRVALMLVELARRHASLMKEVMDVGVIKHYKHQDSKRRLAQVVIAQWMQNFKYKRIFFNKDQRKHGVILRFIAQCKRRTNLSRRTAAADTLRNFLREARDRASKVTFTKFKKRIRIAQRHARSYIICRRTRLQVLSLLWRKTMKEQRELLAKQLKQQEIDLLGRVMQNENMKTVIRRLQFARQHIGKCIRRAEACTRVFQRTLPKPRWTSSDLADDDELTPEEKRILVRILWEQRRAHQAADDALREARRKVPIADISTAARLLKANDAEIVEISKCFTHQRLSKHKMFTPFSMFLGHLMLNQAVGASAQSLREIIDQKVEEYLIREFDAKQQRQIEFLLRTQSPDVPITRVHLVRTSAGWALEVVGPQSSTWTLYGGQSEGDVYRRPSFVVDMYRRPSAVGSLGSVGRQSRRVSISIQTAAPPSENGSFEGDL